MKRRNQRGAVSVEVALLVPVLVLVAAGATAGWRLWWAGGQVQAAAEAAARAASVVSNTQAANQAVAAVVTADLETAGVHCKNVSISQDVAAVNLPPGVPGTVYVEVTCAVGMSDLLLPMPGSITVYGSADEAIDVYSRRGR
ncbi:MAG: pilus assembly protein [Propionibacteriaceae bacterium]|nr:pilus assembly protein [Propionibacteriaceae bacterium]